MIRFNIRYFLILKIDSGHFYNVPRIPKPFMILIMNLLGNVFRDFEFSILDRLI